MKKVFNLSIILAALTAALTFSSCGNNEDAEAPEIIISSVTDNSVFGQILTDNDLKSVDLQQDGRSVTGWPKTDFKTVGQPIVGKDGNYTINIFGLTAGTKYKLVAVDKNDKQDSKEFTTTGGGTTTGGEIQTWSAKLLGAQNSSNGSAFASIDGGIFSQSQSNANANIIDITYGVLSGNSGAFISPSTRGSLGFNTITGGTITHFVKTTFTAAQFTAMTDDEEFATGITATATDVRNIAVGDVYFFQNAAGKKGLIHVSALVAGASGSVTINVKVQK